MPTIYLRSVIRLRGLPAPGSAPPPPPLPRDRPTRSTPAPPPARERHAVHTHAHAHPPRTHPKVPLLRRPAGRPRCEEHPALLKKARRELCFAPASQPSAHVRPQEPARRGGRHSIWSGSTRRARATTTARARGRAHTHARRSGSAGDARALERRARRVRRGGQHAAALSEVPPHERRVAQHAREQGLREPTHAVEVPGAPGHT